MSNHIFKHYQMTDPIERTIAFTKIAFYLNLCIGIIKLLLGFYFHSFWFIITALYYIVLCFARGHILHCFKRLDKAASSSQLYHTQLQIYHCHSYFMIALGISYFMICLWMYFYEQRIIYPNYIIFGVAAIAFYKIGMSIYGFIRIRKMDHPILNVIKLINFSDACVSIVATQCALLTMQASIYASRSSATLGMVISICFLILGMYISKRHAKSIR